MSEAGLHRVLPLLGAAWVALAAGAPPAAAMGVLPNPRERALWTAGQAFRDGNADAAAAALEPWITRSAQVAREALALRFVEQDYEGALALAVSVPAAAQDDEARLWVARSEAALGRWDGCLRQLGKLKRSDRPWALSLRAEALAGLNDPAARDAFAEALSATAGGRLEAWVAIQAAEADEAAGDDDAAEGHYRRAERADPSYTQVNLRLAALYRRHERWKEARQRLERAQRVDPDAEGPREALRSLLAALPEQRQALRRDEDKRLKSFAQRSNPVVEPIVMEQDEPAVRVGLVTGAARFKFRLGGAMVDEATGLTLPANSAWIASVDTGPPPAPEAPERKGKRHGRRAKAKPQPAAPAGPRPLAWILSPLAAGLSPTAAAAEPRTLTASLRLRPLDPGTTFGLFEVDHGAGYFFARSEDRYYRGVLEIRQGPDGLTVVNELGMEAYLSSVVPSEVSPKWPQAALRAQAIAARTESWSSLGRFKSHGYDLCPTVLCAVYSGVGTEDRRTTAAVTDTAGVVMEGKKGRLAAANYMDNSGGHTMANFEAWPGRKDESLGVIDAPVDAVETRKLFPVGPSSLLHFIDDLDNDVRGWPMHEGHSIWRWTLELTPEDLAPSVERRGRAGRVRTVAGLERSEGGYLERVRIVGDQREFIAASDRIRTALKGLKSNLFYVEARYDVQGRTSALLFHGGGWGHGVGMSQTGARSMADSGLDELDILKHYFPNETLHKRYTR